MMVYVCLHLGLYALLLLVFAIWTTRPRWERAFRGPLRRRPFHFNEETQLFEQRKPSSDHLVDADGCLAKITGRDKQELKVKRKGSKSVKKSTKKRPRDADTQATDETLENEVEAMEV